MDEPNDIDSTSVSKPEEEPLINDLHDEDEIMIDASEYKDLCIEEPEQEDQIENEKQVEQDEITEENNPLSEEEKANLKEIVNDQKEEKRLKEEDVGIKQYVSERNEIFGIIKQRYSDFLVNEISHDGEVIELTDDSIPPPPVVSVFRDDSLPVPSCLTPEILLDLKVLADQAIKRGASSNGNLIIPEITKDEVNEEIVEDVNKNGAKPSCGQNADEVKNSIVEIENENKNSIISAENDAKNPDVQTENETNNPDVQTENKTNNPDVQTENDTNNPDAQTENDTNNPDVQTENKTNNPDVQTENETNNPDVQTENDINHASIETENEQKQSVIENENGIEKSIDNKVSNSPKKEEKTIKEVVINVTGLDKIERSAVHQYIKTRYRNVSANTLDKNDEKFIIVIPGLDSRTKKSLWPKDKSFTTFTLYKENIDTMEAINIMTWRLHMKPDKVGYAGTKDRRGKTSQQLSVYQVPPQNLVNSIKFRHGVLRIGNFKYQKEGLVLGHLKGNRFQTVIREVKGEDDIINEAIESLKTKGFINYYGMQRFGTTSVPTYSIGCVLLKGQWKEATDLILKQRSSDFNELAKAKKIWFNENDAHKAYNILGCRKYTIEGALLNGLKNTTKQDYLSALFKIPSKTRMLYLHSYQSYIWNCIVSRRIEKYGLKVIAGDIVALKSKTDNESNQNNAEIVDKSDCIEDFSCQIFPEKDNENNQNGSGDTVDEDIIEETNIKHKVHILSEEEAENEEITNILMPLPGFYMTYPDNEMKEWYVELMEKDDLTLDMLKSKHKAFSLGGSYRHILVQPNKVNGNICYYDDPLKPLISSDLHKLRQIPVTENRLSEGKHKAILLDFRLPPSSYATMALREILKIDTSSQYQKSLNSSDLDSKAQLPWQKSPEKNNRTDGDSRGGRGGNRGSPRGNRGRGGRSRVWGSRGGGDRGRGSWSGGRNRGSWMDDRGRGRGHSQFNGPPRGYQGGNAMGWRGGRGGFDQPSDNWNRMGQGEWRGHGENNWQQNKWRGPRGNSRGFNRGREFKRPMNEGDFSSSKRGRY